MKKKNDTFFQDVLKEVKKVPLTDIVEDFVPIKRNSYADNDAHCPFHADESFGSFKMNDGKNLYKCFSCGESGDGIKFVQEIENLGFKRAVMKIAYMHNIVSKRQAEEYFEGVTENTTFNRIERKVRVKTDDVVEKASNEVLDGLFRAFIDVCELTDEHRAILEERGLSTEQIEEQGFFSFPEATHDFIFRFYKLIHERKLNNQDLKHVPGFVTAEHHREEKDGETRYLYVFQTKKGLGIPVRNSKGQVVGIQVRRDELKGDEKRYGWFSSTYAENKNVYKHGTPAGAPLHTTYAKDSAFKNVVFITEGIFKSLAIANEFQSTAISLQGVGNFHEIVEELQAIEKVQGKIEHIFVAHDADMAQNVNVYLHLKNMVTKVKEAFPDITFYNSLWDDSYGKGIDDLIQNGEVSRLRRIDMDTFIEMYDAIIEPLQKEHEKNIRAIKKEFVKEVFIREVFNPLMTA